MKTYQEIANEIMTEIETINKKSIEQIEVLEIGEFQDYSKECNRLKRLLRQMKTTLNDAYYKDPIVKQAEINIGLFDVSKKEHDKIMQELEEV